MNPFVQDPDWGWYIILYFFFGGLAAGCYFAATLIELFGGAEDRPLARIGYRVAFPLILVCAVLLVVDLERPERFWHMVLQSEVVEQALAEGWPGGGWGTMLHAFMLKWWSPMSIGAQALGVFGLCSFISFLGTFRTPRPVDHPAGLIGRAIGFGFKVIGCAVGFFIAAYTGALLSATNQPLWVATDWIAPLFLTSAASTSISLLLLLGGRVSEASRERLERADLWALGLELFIFLVFLASLGGLLPLALQTREGQILVGATLILGLVFPLWLHLSFKQPGRGRVTLAALSALAGGFFFRYGIVRVAPALLRQFPHVTERDLQTPLYQTTFGIVLLAVTLILALLIPYLLARRWRLSAGQTLLAGVVSLLVLTGVGFYAASAQPQLDPTFRLTISPEAGRERGGGPGASDVNRPKTLTFHSQVTGVGK